MATINGLNGILQKPIATTLDDLLKDDRFGIRESQVSRVDYNEDQLYQICLGLFIRGDSKECLEKMYEFGFLEARILTKDERIYSLFQGACDAVKNFNSLGISLKGVIRRTFTGDTDHLKDHIIGKSKSFEIAIFNRFYRCCAKVLQMDSTNSGPKLDYLETKVRNEICNYNNIPLFQDPESIVELEQLVETYIFHIQVELMHEQVSTLVYKRLAEFVPGLSENLNRISENGKTIEQRILQKLESKQRKLKKFNRRSNSSPRQKDTTTTEEILPNLESQQPQLPSSSLEQQEPQLQVTPRWIHICYRYIRRVKFSHQTLIFIVLLLFLSSRKFKSIYRIPQYITNATRVTIPHVRGIFRLLSSI